MPFMYRTLELHCEKNSVNWTFFVVLEACSCPVLGNLTFSLVKYSTSVQNVVTCTLMTAREVYRILETLLKCSFFFSIFHFVFFTLANTRSTVSSRPANMFTTKSGVDFTLITTSLR